MLAFLMINGRFILSITYGEKYAVAIAAFIIYFAGELLRVSGMPIVSAYFAKGRPELNRTLVIVRAVIVVLVIYPMVKYYGLIGAASSTVIAITFALSFQLKAIHRLTDLNIGVYLLTLFKGICLFLAGYIINGLLSTVVSNDLVKVAIGVVVYCTSLVTAYFIFPEINSIARRILATGKS
jgi:O-antigen/teichoic acid export membrane protein